MDLHTGLGAVGYGELIHPGGDETGIELTKRIFGSEVRVQGLGDSPTQSSVSARVVGSFLGAVTELVPTGSEVAAIALEFGTLSILEVLTALRADNWLHEVAGLQPPLRNEIKQQIRHAFYVDRPFWKTAVYGRTADMVLRAARGLASH